MLFQFDLLHIYFLYKFFVNKNVISSKCLFQNPLFFKIQYSIPNNHDATYCSSKSTRTLHQRLSEEDNKIEVTEDDKDSDAIIILYSISKDHFFNG